MIIIVPISPTKPFSVACRLNIIELSMVFISPKRFVIRPNGVESKNEIGARRSADTKLLCSTLDALKKYKS